MSLLQELLEAVKDEHLPLEALEKYRDQLTHLKATMHLALADCKKSRALFLLASEEKTAAAKKIAWEASKEGQRLLELEGYIRAVSSELGSLQGRIYGAIR